MDFFHYHCSFVVNSSPVTPSFSDLPIKPVSGVQKNIEQKLGWFSIFWGVAPHEKETRHLGDQVVHIMKKWSSYEKTCSLNTKLFRFFQENTYQGLIRCWSNFTQTKGQTNVTCFTWPPRVFCWFLISPCLCRRHAPPYSAYGFYGGHGIRCLWGQGCGVPPVTIWHDTFSSTSRPKQLSFALLLLGAIPKIHICIVFSRFMKNRKLYECTTSILYVLFATNVWILYFYVPASIDLTIAFPKF